MKLLQDFRDSFEIPIFSLRKREGYEQFCLLG